MSQPHRAAAACTGVARAAYQRVDGNDAATALNATKFSGRRRWTRPQTGVWNGQYNMPSINFAGAFGSWMPLVLRAETLENQRDYRAFNNENDHTANTTLRFPPRGRRLAAQRLSPALGLNPPRSRLLRGPGTAVRASRRCRIRQRFGSCRVCRHNPG
jgi:hypothetical protein